MYIMYGNMGLEAHFDNDHTIGISMLLKENNNNKKEIGIKQWILFDMKYLSKASFNGNFSIEAYYNVVAGRNIQNFYVDFEYSYSEISKIVQENDIPHYKINQQPGSIVIVPNEFLHVTTIVCFLNFLIS